MIKLRELPDTNKFTVLHAAANQSAAIRSEFSKRLTNSYKCPVELISDALTDYVSSLLEACANDKMSWVDLLDKAAVLVEKGFGTHTSKFPNANLVLAEAALMALTPRSTIGAVSSNTHLTRQYLCAGNASDIPAQRLLCAVLRLDGDIISVAEDLSDHGPIFHEIRKTSQAIAASVDNLAVKIRRRLNTPSILSSALNQPKTKNHGGIPTIFWPIDQHARVFHLLSPVTSIPMVAEVQTRQLANDLNLGDRHATKIGGGKSLNAGLLAMDHGGFIAHFLSLPPNMTKRKPTNLTSGFQSLERLIDHDGTIIRNNVVVKQAQRNVVDGMIDAIINDMLDPPYGSPATPTVSLILETLNAMIIQRFVLRPDYLEIFRNVYSETFLETAARYVAALEGIV